MSIEVKNLTHIYMPNSPFEAVALDNVSITVEDGDFVGIIGHTGSGKSTLIAHLNALEKNEPGHVFVNGHDLGDKEVKLADIRREVGLVFQYPEYQLFEETIAKDIAFGPKNQKLDEKEIEARVEYAMQAVGLDLKLKDTSPFGLSGGQKRRVAIAGVLAMKPNILILDEPAAGLDPSGRRGMLDLIEGIHKSGVTVIMVSHSMDDVGKYCNKLYVMNKGKVAFEGAPRDVFTHGEELKAIGLDVPQGATLAKKLREKGFDIPEGVYRLAEIEEVLVKQLKKTGGNANA